MNALSLSLISSFNTQVAFSIPRQCFCISDRTKDDFNSEVNRENGSTKADGLFRSSPSLMAEIMQQVRG